jgi:hypothetical protein
VLFGGQIGMTDSDETWVLGETDWAQRTPAISPPARSGAQMAYDPVRRVVVLFGGVNYAAGGINAVLDDTWLWDGTAWTRANCPVANPPGRAYGTMVFDEARQEMVMHDGFASGILVLHDTWVSKSGG